MLGQLVHFTVSASAAYLVQKLAYMARPSHLMHFE